MMIFFLKNKAFFELLDPFSDPYSKSGSVSSNSVNIDLIRIRIRNPAWTEISIQQLQNVYVDAQPSISVLFLKYSGLDFAIYVLGTEIGSVSEPDPDPHGSAWRWPPWI